MFAVLFVIAIYGCILHRARLSVTVMPHSDAASSVYCQHHLLYKDFLDAASECGMTVTDSLTLCRA